MKKNKLISWESAIVIVTILIFALANSLHVFVEWRKNKPDEVFHAIAHSYPDYFLYLSHIAQGANGSLIFTDHQFTNEPLPKTSIYWVYSLFGFVGNLFHISPPWIYNFSLIILSTIVLFLWYLFCRFLYPSDQTSRLITFVVIVSASPFIHLQTLLTRGVIEFPQYLWFSPTLSFNRLGGAPHQIVQTLLLLVTLICLSKISTMQRYSRQYIIFVFLLLILSFVTAYAHPLQMAILLLSVGISMLISMWQEKRITTLHLIPFLLCGLVSIPAAFLVNKDYATSVYAISRQWELLQYRPTGFFWWMSILGPISFFIPFGIWPCIKRADQQSRIFFIYGANCFMLYHSSVPVVLGIVSQRFLSPVSYALFPVLAVSGFMTIFRMPLSRFFKFYFIFFTALVYLVYTVPADVAQIHTRVTDPSITQVAFLNHTPVSIVEGLKTIQSIPSTPTNSVVLAQNTLSVDLLIPLYTGHKSFLGQSTHTLYPDVKDALRTAFFSHTLRKEEATQFVKNHRIGVVIASKTNENLEISYPFLTKTFENTLMTIYVVQQESLPY